MLIGPLGVHNMKHKLFAQTMQVNVVAQRSLLYV